MTRRLPKVAVLKVLHVLQLFYLQSPLAVSTPQVLLCLLMCVELMTKVSEAISVSIMKTLDKYSSCLKAVLDVKTSDTNCHLLQTFKNKGGQLYPPFVLMVRSFK